MILGESFEFLDIFSYLKSRTADGESHGDVGPAALTVVLP